MACRLKNVATASSPTHPFVPQSPSVGTNVVNTAFAENSTPGKEQNFLPLARADRNGNDWHRLNMKFYVFPTLAGFALLARDLFFRRPTQLDASVGGMARRARVSRQARRERQGKNGIG
jgi:hypothetical protein